MTKTYGKKRDVGVTSIHTVSAFTTIRDWSGWLATLASIGWNIKQYVDIKHARSEADQARRLLHDQRILQLATSLTNDIGKITYLVEDGRRSVVRQECQQLAGNMAHFQTYAATKIERLHASDFTEIYTELRNVLRGLGSSSDERLSDLEQEAVRDLAQAAVVTARAFQGLLEKEQDLRDRDSYLFEGKPK